VVVSQIDNLATATGEQCDATDARMIADDYKIRYLYRARIMMAPKGGLLTAQTLADPSFPMYIDGGWGTP
jgi:hypothetical protein